MADTFGTAIDEVRRFATELTEPTPTRVSLLTLVADACRGGTEIPVGVELVGLLDNDLRCLFAPIDLGPWGPYFSTAAAWYRGVPFDMVQLLYPDRNGFMPYETGYEQRMALAQPVIGTV